MSSGASPRRAFTLVEMAMIVFLLLLIATAVVPRVIPILNARALQDQEGRIARLPLEARNEALRSQMPMRLRITDGALVLEQAPPGQPSERVQQLSLSGLQVVRVEQNGQPADPGSWQWTVYPDGSAQSGGVEFAEGALRKSLLLTSDGRSQWVVGGISDQTPEWWPAGQLAAPGG
jgi:hypothetical protein